MRYAYLKYIRGAEPSRARSGPRCAANWRQWLAVQGDGAGQPGPTGQPASAWVEQIVTYQEPVRRRGLCLGRKWITTLGTPIDPEIFPGAGPGRMQFSRALARVCRRNSTTQPDGARPPLTSPANLANVPANSRLPSSR